jgi:hypothetical protein
MLELRLQCPPFLREVHRVPLDSTTFFFKIRLVGGEFHLGSLSMSATNWPIVPALGDYEDGEFGGIMIGRGS